MVFVLGWAFLIEAGGPAHEDLRVIDAVIRQHGKPPFVKMILANRSGRITLDVDGKQKTGYGPPNQRFVTAATIAQDLASMGADVEDLPELLSPYLEVAGPNSNHDGFAVSDANLTSIAKLGQISGSDSTAIAMTGAENGPENSRPGAAVSDSNKTEADLKVTELEQRLAELWKEHERMKLSEVEPRLLSEKTQEIARLERELKKIKMDGLNKTEKVSQQKRLAQESETKKAFWVDKMKKAVDEVKRLKAEVEALEKKKGELEKGLSTFRGDGWYTDQWGVRREKTRGYNEIAIEQNLESVRERLSRARRALSSAESRLDKLQVEARRDGALPGWFRGLE